MTYGQPGRTTRYTTRRIRLRWIRVAGLLAIAALAVAFGGRWTSSPSLSSGSDATSSKHHPSLGENAGAIPDGTTVFDDDVPGVAKLDPALLRALRQAATDAAYNGVRFFVDSGWRSRAYQEHLLQKAVVKYGSLAAASRWVATPTTSAHVSGDAVDIGHANATAWLSAYGTTYGLCQIYDNEPWHYELRPEAIDHGCPARYADAAHDPRMQR